MTWPIFQRDNWLWLKKEMLIAWGGSRLRPSYPRIYRGRRGFYLYDRHFEPQSRFRARRKVVAFCALFFLWLFFLNYPDFNDDPDARADSLYVWFNLGFACAVWVVIFLPFIWIVAHRMNLTKTRYFFRYDGKTRFGLWRKLKPGESFTLRVVEHRAAAKEQRAAERFYRVKEANDARTFRTDYSDASQLDLVRAAGGWFTLADFEDDRAGNRASVHISAIEKAVELRNAMPEAERLALPPLFPWVVLKSPFVFARWLVTLPARLIARRRGESPPRPDRPIEQQH